MSTIREQVVEAVVTGLNAARPEGIPAAVRTRMESPTLDSLPALTVYQDEEIVRPMHDTKDEERQASRGDIVRRHVDVNIEALVAAVDDAADKAADPLLAWATKAIVGLGYLKPLLSKLPEELGTKFKYEVGECRFCRATMVMRLYYQSRTDNAELLM